jgi:dCMP deaminase
MKEKHVRLRIAQCLELAKASYCSRRKFGAMLIDPNRNVVVADGYNGPPKGPMTLCGGDICERDKSNIPSGTQLEVGCHHAEANVICNAASMGRATEGMTLIVTGEPCLMCSKLIHHAGISKVICVRGGYLAGSKGVEYLRSHKINVDYADGPKDPRLGDER